MPVLQGKKEILYSIGLELYRYNQALTSHWQIIKLILKRAAADSLQQSSLSYGRADITHQHGEKSDLDNTWYLSQLFFFHKAIPKRDRRDESLLNGPG
jgi:hypothetical protein